MLGLYALVNVCNDIANGLFCEAPGLVVVIGRW
jgi:hypothetical protein